MDFKIYPAPNSLKKYIRYFWSCDVNEPFSKRSILFKNYADRFPRLVFQVDNKPLMTSIDNEPTPQAYICGIDTYTTRAKIDANFSHFGASFYPFALFQVFRVNSQELVDTNLDLKLIGHANLVDLLNKAQNHQERIKLISSFVADKINAQQLINSSIQEIILNNHISFNSSLFETQKKHHLTERTLERLFKTNLGISPKKYQRMVRFEKALELLNSDAQHDMSAIAYQLHYADQSHFIKDFKAFSSITPLEFQKQNFLFSESAAFISEI